jgi:hypothetical protein
MGALLRAVPTGFPRSRQVRVGTAHAIEFVARPSIVQRAPLPTLRRISLSRFSFLFFSTRHSLFCLSPDRGVGGAPTDAGCQRTPEACNNAADQAPSGVPTSLSEGRRASRRSTVAILGRGPRFLLRHFLRIRAASSSQPGRSAWRAGPRASRACSCEPQPRDATPRSTFRIASRRRPSRARLMRPIHQSRIVVKLFLTNRSRQFSASARPRWRPTPRSGRTGWRAPQGCGCRPGWD